MENEKNGVRGISNIDTFRARRGPLSKAGDLAMEVVSLRSLVTSMSKENQALRASMSSRKLRQVLDKMKGGHT